MDQKTKDEIIKDILNECFVACRMATHLKETMGYSNCIFDITPFDKAVTLMGVGVISCEMILIYEQYRDEIIKLKNYTLIEIGLNEISKNFIKEIEETNIRNKRFRNEL